MVGWGRSSGRGWRSKRAMSEHGNRCFACIYLLAEAYSHICSYWADVHVTVAGAMGSGGGTDNDDLPPKIAAGLDTLHNPTTHNTVRYGLQRLQQRRPCPSTMSPSLPKRVCIVGAGASGMSAAYALSKHPDKFVVTVFDKAPVAGGMATSIDIDPSKYGATYINDGVQGCSPAFANTLRMFRILGFESTEVGMQYDSHAPSHVHNAQAIRRISFGKGDNFWSNVFPSKLVAQYQKDIAKFGRALSVIKKLEPAFAMIPVHSMLRIFRFSSGFGERMVYPLVALFFGTGNQTPYIASAILVGAEIYCIV